ncbi:hypothetical protein SLEP1_g34547 [Rubroshorea leprosula]|uniref:Uncharacterized protein n=1 Tax=Rubroshorea leprosula TaxID=152421 RepID=A0AAV5KKB1_9ROSI|nr:hypothetical protein SLEP1_g34547 [Rubroshorea leprosula]
MPSHHQPPPLYTNQPAPALHRAQTPSPAAFTPLLPRTSLVPAPALHRTWPQSRAFYTRSPALSTPESPALCTSHHRQSCPARPSHQTPPTPLCCTKSPAPFCAQIACTLHQPSPAIMPCTPEPSYPPTPLCCTESCPCRPALLPAPALLCVPIPCPCLLHTTAIRKKQPIPNKIGIID